MTEGAVEFAAETGKGVGDGDGTANVGLIEECEDTVALLEAGDAFAGGDDGAGAVGARDYRVGDGERVFALAKVCELDVRVEAETWDGTLGMIRSRKFREA